MKILIVTLTALPVAVTLFTAGCATEPLVTKSITDRMAAHPMRIVASRSCRSGSEPGEDQGEGHIRRHPDAELERSRGTWGARPPRALWLAPSPTTFASVAPGSPFVDSPRFGANRRGGGRKRPGRARSPLSTASFRPRRLDLRALTLVSPPCPNNLARHLRYPELHAQVP